MRLTRRHGIFLVAFLAGVAALVIAAPYVVPTERVRLALGRIVGSYLGTEVVATGEIRVRLLPLAIDFRQARFTPKDSTTPLMAADRVRVTVDLPQYLLGRSPVAAVDIVRPVIDLPQGMAAPDLTQPKHLARLTPVRVTMRGGTLRRATPVGPETILGKVDLDYSWPRLTAKLRMTASFDWRGERVSVATQGVSPRSLSSGVNGDVSMSLETSFLKLAFAGKAISVDRLQVDGPASLSLSDFARGMALLGYTVPATFATSRIELEGRLRSAGLVFMLQDAGLHLGDADAEGVLSARFDGPRPILRGTLDFDALAFTPAGATQSATSLATLACDRQALDITDIDLRLSAIRLLAGDIDMRDIGATIVVTDGRLEAQASAGSAMGGEASLHVAGTPDEEGMRMVVDGSLDRVAASPLWSALGGSDIRAGTVTVRASLRAAGSDLLDMAQETEARVTLQGTGIALNARPAAGTPLALQGAAARLTAPMEFDRVDAEAVFRNGEFKVNRLTANARAGSFDLAGTSSALGGQMRLTGAFVPTHAAAPASTQPGATAKPERIPVVLSGTRAAPQVLIGAGATP